MTSDLINAALNLGPSGFLIGFMIWDRTQQNRLTKERTEADLEMARAMTLLAAKVDR